MAAKFGAGLVNTALGTGMQRAAVRNLPLTMSVRTLLSSFLSRTAARMKIDERTIGPDQPPYIIAELSANHGGSLARALKSIEAAKAAGAHAVKFQTYTADTITLDASGPGFDITEGPWAGRRLYDLYQAAATPWEWHEALFAHARGIGITPFSTPFDLSAVKLLQQLDAPAYKIASFELTDHGLIAACAATGKPLIISTGMASDEEVREAVAVAKAAGANDLIVLHCVSGYPTPIEQANLQRIVHLRSALGVDVGLSDHTLGNAVPVAATVLGAVAIEKHFMLDREEQSEDAFFSLLPEELGRLVLETGAIWQATRQLRPGRAAAEEGSVQFRRSLYIAEDVAPGDVFTSANVRSVRPGFGLHPKYLPAILGRRAAVFAKKGAPLAWDHLASDENRKLAAGD
jgi:N-acetylneuraminate synthase